MSRLLLNATIVNEGSSYKGSIFINEGKIVQIFPEEFTEMPEVDEIVDCTGKYIIPGVIDDQVHFREPGLTHKADINSESRAAVAGGITSFMEMPNTSPQTTTNALLAEKFAIAAQQSVANYSFYLGATNTNIDELLQLDKFQTCGVKVFMGSSTGNMLVDDINTLERIFSSVTVPIAVHCEDEQTIKENLELYKNEFGDTIPVHLHPKIRSAEACYKSSALAVSLAKKYNTRLHVLHVSTAKELELFESCNLDTKRITAEVCVHHLWFDENDYEKKGALIRWNPAIKSETDKLALRKALINNKLDVIATDHAPHLLSEKNEIYTKAASGGPLVQHALVAMLQLVKQDLLSIELMVEKMCHAPAQLFSVSQRGYIREGYWADIVVLDLDSPWTVDKDNLLYKCKWSPFEGYTFDAKVLQTYVNGVLKYDADTIIDNTPGMQLCFDR
ncbi:MAG: dihydroorotase [Bacteroidales bacterium]|nr:dihydroorotase [Bacteroidales bacterium]